MSTRHPSQQIAQRDRQVLDHLLSIADSEGRLSGSTYAIACELGMHRQTLSRILQRLAKSSTTYQLFYQLATGQHNAIIKESGYSVIDHAGR